MRFRATAASLPGNQRVDEHVTCALTLLGALRAYTYETREASVVFLCSSQYAPGRRHREEPQNIQDERLLQNSSQADIIFTHRGATYYF